MIFIRRLIWEAWDVAHIARHGVTPEEVDEVCHGDPVSRQSYAGRIMLIGLTRSGRMLVAVLTPRGRGAFYPVTARPASRQERQRYQDDRESANQ